MALATELESLDDLPETLKSLYVEHEGKFMLDVDGGLPDAGWRDKVHSLNKENEKRRKEAQELQDKLAAVDIEEYNALKEKAAELEKERLLAAGKQEEVANKALEKLNAEHKKQLEAIKSESELAKSKIEQYKTKALIGEINSSINGAGFHEYCTEEVIDAAMKVFSLNEEGNVVALDSDGLVIIGKDGKTPYSVKEWANSSDVREKKPHWLKSGIGGSGGQQGFSRPNASKDLSHLPAIERLTAARKLANKT
jgi:hypothetical protein